MFTVEHMAKTECTEINMHRYVHLGSFQNPEWQKHPQNQDFDQRSFVVETLSISGCGESVVIVHIKTTNLKTVADI